MTKVTANAPMSLTVRLCPGSTNVEAIKNNLVPLDMSPANMADRTVGIDRISGPRITMNANIARKMTTSRIRAIHQVSDTFISFLHMIDK